MESNILVASAKMSKKAKNMGDKNSHILKEKKSRKCERKFLKL